MALTGDGGAEAAVPLRADETVSRLVPQPGHPLHFSVKGCGELNYRPYFEIDTELFSCFPTME